MLSARAPPPPPQPSAVRISEGWSLARSAMRPSSNSPTASSIIAMFLVNPGRDAGDSNYVDLSSAVDRGTRAEVPRCRSREISSAPGRGRPPGQEDDLESRRNAVVGQAETFGVKHYCARQGGAAQRRTAARR